MIPSRELYRIPGALRSGLPHSVRISAEESAGEYQPNTGCISEKWSILRVVGMIEVQCLSDSTTAFKGRGAEE